MSDMEEGYGATDIYRIPYFENGEWGKHENLGPNVNTFGHELFPTIHASGNLYFSSNTHPGMGKLDIFKAEYEEGVFSNVQNMKPPINSIGDDFALVLDKNEQKGFFSSDRFNGLGRDDVYSYLQEYPIEIVINGEYFELEDLSLYAGIDYSVKNKESKEEVTLSYDKGKYKFKLPKEGDTYTLSLRKQGFPYNKVDLSIERNSKENFLKVEAKSKFKEVAFAGVLNQEDIVQGVKFVEKPNPIDSLPPLIDTVYISDTNLLPIQGANVYLENASGELEKHLTDGQGKFKLENACMPMQSYTIRAPLSEKVVLDPFVHYRGKFEINGEAIGNVSMNLTLENGEQINFTSEDDGSYYFKYRPNVAFAAQVNKAGFQSSNTSIAKNQYQPGDTVNLPLALLKKEMVTVVGNIMDEDSLILPNTLVTLTSKGKIVGQSTTNEKGEFTFALLSGEEYNVVAAKQGYLSNEKIIDRSQTDPEGNFEFELEKNEDYTISAIKPGYIPAEQNVTTKELLSDGPIELNLVLEKNQKRCCGKG